VGADSSPQDTPVLVKQTSIIICRSIAVTNKKLMKKIFNRLAITATMLVLPVVTFAQGAFYTSVTGQGSFGALLGNIISFINGILIPFIIGIGFLFFVWGMFQFFIGFVLIIIFWGVVNLLAGSTGFSGQNAGDGVPGGLPNAAPLPGSAAG